MLARLLPFTLLLAALLLGGTAPAVCPQQGASPPAPDAVERRLAELEGVDAPAAEVERGILRDTLAAIGRQAAAREREARLQNEAESTLARRAALEEREGATAPAEELTADAELSLDEWEAERDSAEAEVDAARAALADLEQRAATRKARLAAIPDEVAQLQQTLVRERELLSGPEADPLDRARRELAAATVAALQAELEALQAERDALTAETSLTPLRRTDAQRRLSVAQEAASFWQDAIGQRRESEAGAAAVAARAQEARFDIQEISSLAKIAATNAKLAEQSSGPDGLPRRLEKTRDDIEAAVESWEWADQRYSSARRRLQAGGLTQTMGETLRSDLDQLATARRLRGDARDTAERLARVQIEILELEELDPGAVTTEQRVEELIASLAPASEAEASDLRGVVLELVREKRERRQEVLDQADELQNLLYELTAVRARRAQLVGEYRSYIQERILWIRSLDGDPVPSLLAVPRDLWAVIAAAGDDQSTQQLDHAWDKRWGEIFGLGLALIVVLAARRSLRRRLGALADEVRSYRTDRFGATLWALLLTLLLALPLPLLLWTVGRLIGYPPPAVPIGADGPTGGLAFAVGQALEQVAPILLVVEYVRLVAKERGLGEVHFRWPSRSMEQVRGEFNWFVPAVAVLATLHYSLERYDSGALAHSLGRFSFVLVLGALGVFIKRFLDSDGPLDSDADPSTRSLMARSRAVWQIGALSVVLGLIALSLAGYHYTATQLEVRLRYSLFLALALGAAQALMLRWLFVARRRLAIEHARERARARAEEAAEHGDVQDAASESGGATAIDESAVDIPALDAQTRQLFRSSITLAAVVGAYLIWAGALPALQELDRVQLLPKPALLASPDQAPIGGGLPSSTLEAAPAGSESAAETTASAGSLGPLGALTGSASGGGGEDPVASGALPASLTLADVLLALLILTLTIIGARNVPGLLEIVLLQRLPLDVGARYAVTTIVRYLIAIAGISAVSGALGIGWEKVQWLAAALTFGLAFGLQEIFANFVSGLIILIERPIRVGDIVTVAGTEGRVTRLRMRATTIQDWDRKEYLIPNKDFITGNVVNWTLTDPVTRVVVPVGIAYGSDTVRAHSLLVEVAQHNSLVLQEPRPRALFLGFGDSSLNFEVRVFIANRDLWPQMVHTLHMEIDQAFREAGIEISFPQRDLHVRSVDADVLRGFGHGPTEAGEPGAAT